MQIRPILAAAILVLSLPWGYVATASERTILILGDSLAAAYGIALEQGWVALLQERLRDGRLPYHVINASVSGDTTQGGLARLPDLLDRHQPEIVILELGGNDGLRALPTDLIRDNLAAMVEVAQGSGATVVLTGIRIPPNYGPRYTEKFQSIYPELAEQFGLTLVPFLLEGVAGDAELMQDDGVHPAAGGQPIILENVWAELEPHLRNHREPGSEPGS